MFLTELSETNLTAKELFTRVPHLDLMYNFYRWYLQNKQNVIILSFLYNFVNYMDFQQNNSRKFVVLAFLGLFLI